MNISKKVGTKKGQYEQIEKKKNEAQTKKYMKIFPKEKKIPTKSVLGNTTQAAHSSFCQFLCCF